MHILKSPIAEDQKC